MQINEKERPSDAPAQFIGQNTPTLFESAIRAAVLQEVGPLYDEIIRIFSGQSDGNPFLQMLRDLGDNALLEMKRCPYPDRREMIRLVYINEMKFLSREYDRMMADKFSPSNPGDGGTEQLST